MSEPQSKRTATRLRLKVQVWIWFRARADGAPRVLVLRLNEQRGGFWQPVTGGVEDNEPTDAAALREAREETGLDFGTALPERLDHEFEFEGSGSRSGRRFRETCYSLEAPRGNQGDPGIRLDPREHVESAWVTADEAFRRLRFPSNAAALDALLRRLATTPQAPEVRDPRKPH